MLRPPSTLAFLLGLGVAGLIPEASLAGTADPVVRIDTCAEDFGSRLVQGPLPIDVSVAIAAGQTLLVLVEETGRDVVLTRLDDGGATRVDLPPSGRARQALVVAPEPKPRDPVLLRIELGSGSAPHEGLRLRHACVDGNQSPVVEWFSLLEAAGRVMAGLSTPGSDLSRATSELETISVRAASMPIDPRFAEFRAQISHTRAFLSARGGQPAESRAAYLAAAGEWAAGGRPIEAWIARHRAAQQARRMGRFDEALGELTALVDDTLVAGAPALRAVAQNDRCLTLRNLDRIDDALACFPKAVAWQIEAGDLGEAALSQANFAELLIGRGELEPAALLLAEARTRAGGSASNRVKAFVAMIDGLRARAQGQIGVAIARYSEAIEHARRHGDPAVEAAALVGLGSSYLLGGDLARARELIGVAVERYRIGGYSDALGRALVLLAMVERRAGDPEAALRHATAALAERIDATASEARRPAHLVAAESALDLGRPEAALAHLELLVPEQAEPRSKLTFRIAQAKVRHRMLIGADPSGELAALAAEAQRHGDPVAWLDALTLGAANHDRHQRDAAALETWGLALDLALGIASSLELPLHQAHFLAGAEAALVGYVGISLRAQGSGTDAIEHRLRAVLRWREAHRRASRSGQAPAGDPSTAALDAALLRYWIDQTTGATAARGTVSTGAGPSLAELMAGIEARSRATGPGAVTPSDPPVGFLQGQAPTLAIFELGSTMFLWRVDERGVAEHRVDAAAVASTLDTIGTLLAAPRPERRAAAEAATSLAAVLGLPALLDRPEVGWHLLLDGRLAAVPPVMLVAATRLAERPGSESAWPSVTVLRTLAAQPHAASTPCCADAGLHLFADPVPSAGASSGAPLPWRRLPGARREAAILDAAWRPRPVERSIGASFTAARVLDALAQPGAVVHLATHGLIDRQDPARSGLWVASTTTEEGYELLGWHRMSSVDVAASLVVLSACDAGDGADFDALGSLGIGELLVDRGARAVIAPLRAIEDRASIPFQSDLYAALARGAPPARALAEAQSMAWARGDVASALAFVALSRH
jgi:tetratricopeptide (TPR) repeat protein